MPHEPQRRERQTTFWESDGRIVPMTPDRSCHEALSVLGDIIATQPTAEAWQTLRAKLTGHYQYYNVNDNWRWVMKYREAARRMGLRWLRRRSQNSRITWECYNDYLREHPLPNPDRIVDLIAMARRICDDAKRSSQIQWLF